MFHVQVLTNAGPNGSAFGAHFETLEEAQSVTEALPFVEGDWQEISDDKGNRRVRAFGRSGPQGWMVLDRNRPRTGGWGEPPALS